MQQPVIINVAPEEGDSVKPRVSVQSLGAGKKLRGIARAYGGGDDGWLAHLRASVIPEIFWSGMRLFVFLFISDYCDEQPDSSIFVQF